MVLKLLEFLCSFFDKVRKNTLRVGIMREDYKQKLPTFHQAKFMMIFNA